MNKHARGLLDTSVVIGMAHVDADALPEEMAISSVSLAEIAAGPHATSDPIERARRQEHVQRVEATFDPLPFDADAARAYAHVYAAVAATGRKARGPRALDLMIAATARSVGVPLFTRNPSDFEGLSDLVEIVAVEGRTS